MKTSRFISVLVLMSLTLLPRLAFTEDIDLYTNNIVTGGEPNILIVLDNSSQWTSTMNSDQGAYADDAKTYCPGDEGSFFCAQKLALKQLLNKTVIVNGTEEYLLKPNVGVGLMLYTEDGSNLGGYVRFGVRKMTEVNRAALIELLKTMGTKAQTNGGITFTKDSGGNSAEDYAMLMWEAFKYFGGGSTSSPLSPYKWGAMPTAGDQGGTTKRDQPGNPNTGFTLADGYAYTGTYATANPACKWFANKPDDCDAPTKSYNVRYVPPLSTGECGSDNFLVFMSHSNSQASGADTDAPRPYFKNVNANMSDVLGTGKQPLHANFADEAARYLLNSDVDPTKSGVQNVVTYTIAQYNGSDSDPTNVQGRSQMITLLKSMALQGGGSYYAATSIDELYKAGEGIIKQIQAKNSVFVSAALPASVNTQGLFENQVYIGMFRPDASLSPKWLGNLKQYQLAYDPDTNTLRMADGDGSLAIDGKTGFFKVTARSFWTTDSDMWTKWVPTRTDAASDSPDGPEVQKGGAAQRLREVNRTTQASRKVYTCPLDTNGNSACGASGTPLAGTSYQFNVTGSGPAFASYAAAKKAPAFNLPAASNSYVEDLIAWVRGTDNVPVPSPELGPGGTTTVRPTLHGDVLHSRPVALNYGGRVVVYYGSNEGLFHAVEGKQTTGGGDELWAFVAPEHLSKLNRLRTELPEVFLPSSTTDATNNKDYFLDGPIGVWQEGTTSKTTKAIIYVGARRGGNFIYAFDVTDPAAPEFQFKLTTNTLPWLGQTWSTPKAIRVRDDTATGKVVLIFGAGYDAKEDKVPVDHGSDGQAIYVVDADSGSLIKEFHTASDGSQIATGIPSDVTVVDSDRDGFVDRAYVGDLDGNLWRMDLDDVYTNASTGWKLHKLAFLGTGLKFFFPPDVILQPTFHAVVIGSGDREKPLANTSNDKFFMVKDAKIGKDGSDQTTIAFGDLVPNSEPDPTKKDAAKGWYYALRTTGEKTVNGPTTIGGVVYFGTNMPTPPEQKTKCENDLGVARSYALKFDYGTGARDPLGGVGLNYDDEYSIVLLGGGLPPTPVAGLVDIPGLGVKPFCIGCGDQRSSLESGLPDINPKPIRRKIYWKIKKDT